ncbi:MAG: LamG domain-containing protein [bacterium]|nr:LamG domain-containing protein [bacterium]
MKGFTLVEFLVVALILGLLALGVFTALPRLKKNSDLNSAAQVAASLLIEARARTLSSEGASRFGVHFEPNTITLFTGSVFNPSDASNRAVALPISVEVSCISLGGGASSAVFARLTGETAQYGFVNFRLRSETDAIRTVAVTEAGTIFIDEGRQGLIGYWDFNDGSGSVAGDRGVGGNDGALTNMNTSSAWVSGKMCGALDFDGANDYVRVLGDALDVADDMTISLWVKPSVSSSGFHSSWNYFIWHKDPNQSETTKYELGYYDTNGPRFKPYNQTGTDFDFSANLFFAADTWYHVVYRRLGTLLEIYVDGALVDSRNDFSGNLRLTGSDGEVRIGGQGGSSGFIGTIDEVRMYNRALDTSEIRRLYTVGI